MQTSSDIRSEIKREKDIPPPSIGDYKSEREARGDVKTSSEIKGLSELEQRCAEILRAEHEMLFLGRHDEPSEAQLSGFLSLYLRKRIENVQHNLNLKFIDFLELSEPCLLPNFSSLFVKKTEMRELMDSAVNNKIFIKGSGHHQAFWRASAVKGVFGKRQSKAGEVAYFLSTKLWDPVICIREFNLPEVRYRKFFRPTASLIHEFWVERQANGTPLRFHEKIQAAEATESCFNMLEKYPLQNHIKNYLKALLGAVSMHTGTADHFCLVYHTYFSFIFKANSANEIPAIYSFGKKTSDGQPYLSLMFKPRQSDASDNEQENILICDPVKSLVCTLKEYKYHLHGKVSLSKPEPLCDLASLFFKTSCTPDQLDSFKKLMKKNYNTVKARFFRVYATLLKNSKMQYVSNNTGPEHCGRFTGTKAQGELEFQYGIYFKLAYLRVAYAYFMQLSENATKFQTKWTVLLHDCLMKNLQRTIFDPWKRHLDNSIVNGRRIEDYSFFKDLDDIPEILKVFCKITQPYAMLLFDINTSPAYSLEKCSRKDLINLERCYDEFKALAASLGPQARTASQIAFAMKYIRDCYVSRKVCKVGDAFYLELLSGDPFVKPSQHAEMEFIANHNHTHGLTLNDDFNTPGYQNFLAKTQPHAEMELLVSPKPKA